MSIQRKLVVLSRHGKKIDPKADAITDASVGNLYTNTGSAVRPYVQSDGVTPDDSFLLRSNRVRTMQTGKAILAGVFGYEVPKTAAEAADLDIPGLELRVDDRVDYKGLDINQALYDRLGNAGYFEEWFEDIDAIELEGTKVTPFRQVMRNTGASLVDALGGLIGKGKHLGVIVSHSPILESLAVSLVNSGRKNPMTDAVDMGGAFAEEGFALLGMQYDPNSGKYGDATLQRNGQTYAVDIDAFRNALVA